MFEWSFSSEYKSCDSHILLIRVIQYHLGCSGADGKVKGEEGEMKKAVAVLDKPVKEEEEEEGEGEGEGEGGGLSEKQVSGGEEGEEVVSKLKKKKKKRKKETDSEVGTCSCFTSPL